MSTDYEKLFSSYVTYPSCAVVQTLPYVERCDYVHRTPGCQQYKYINYIGLLYCTMKPTTDILHVLCVALLMTICLLLYVILGCTVDKVFCPALKVVAKVMGLNEHMAGVTLLAFGNGSPDLISTFAGQDIFLSDLFGAGLYVTTLVSAVIFLLQPFKLQASDVLRDMCFFILSCLMVDYAMVSDSNVTLMEASLVLLVYVVYLVVLILDQILLKVSLRVLENRLKTDKYKTAESFNKLDALRSEAFIDIVDRTSRVSINVELTRAVSYNIIAKKNDKLYKQMLETLNPIDKQEWKEGGIGIKMYVIMKAPVVFLLALVIPIVDFELDRHGWSKLLNALQISYFPVILILSIFGNSWTVYNVPVYVYTLLFTIPLTVFVIKTTRTDMPPSYHAVLSVYSMMGSVMIIYSCACEAVSILEVLGIVTHCSVPFLSCTLQAWGNGIGDLVSSIALVRHGYPRMAFAACFGGPFFNSIVSMGGTFMYKILHNPDSIQKVTQSSLGENCVIFLLLTLISVLVWSLTNDFDGRRSIGIFNIFLYGLFFLFAILSECEIIETYAPELNPLDAEIQEPPDDT